MRREHDVVNESRRSRGPADTPREPGLPMLEAASAGILQSERLLRALTYRSDSIMVLLPAVDVALRRPTFLLHTGSGLRGLVT